MRRFLFALVLLTSTMVFAQPAAACIPSGLEGAPSYVFANGDSVGHQCDMVIVDGDLQWWSMVGKGEEYQIALSDGGLIGERTHRKGFEHETDVDPPLYITSPMVLYLTWPMLIGGGIVVLAVGAGLVGSRRKRRTISSVSTESGDRSVGAAVGVE